MISSLRHTRTFPIPASRLSQSIDQSPDPDFSLGSNVFGEQDGSKTRALPIPIPESQSSAPLHLDLDPPSVSFRSLFTPGRLGEGSSRRMASGTRRLTPGSTAHTPAHSPWSLFGELMETEGQLRNPEVSKMQRRSRSNLESPKDIIPESETDPFLGTRASSHLRPKKRLSESPTPEQINPKLPEDLFTDYDSDTSDTSVDSTPALPLKADTVPWFSSKRLHNLPILYRNILKCAVAYFLASLFTFSPYLSGFLSDITSYGPGERRPSPSGHMVATV
jgi:hypothetical protein